MQVTDDLIRSVVHEVLAHMKNGQAVSRNGVAAKSWGVFENVDDAVAAARAAQLEFEKRGPSARKKAVDCIRKICIDRAEQLGREELEETGHGATQRRPRDATSPTVRPDSARARSSNSSSESGARSCARRAPGVSAVISAARRPFRRTGVRARSSWPRRARR